jgi:hypothetical protein
MKLANRYWRKLKEEKLKTVNERRRYFFFQMKSSIQNYNFFQSLSLKIPSKIKKLSPQKQRFYSLRNFTILVSK